MLSQEHRDNRYRPSPSNMGTEAYLDWIYGETIEEMHRIEAARLRRLAGSGVPRDIGSQALDGVRFATDEQQPLF